MLKYLILPIIAFLILLAQPALAADSGNGKIEGILVNKTNGSTSNLANQTIIMQAYKNNAEVDKRTSQTTGDGKFIFEGLPTDSSYLYEFGVTYQEADYYSLPAKFNAGETAKSIEIGVYEVTDSDEKVSVVMSHAIISLANNALTVKEYFLLTNNSNLTFVGKNPSTPTRQRETLKFNLLEGATNFQTSYGLENYRIDGTGVHDSEPLTPAGREVSFSYVIPINSDKLTLSWKVNYSMTRFDLLLQDQNIKIFGTKLSEETPLNITGQTYRDYSGNNLVPGDTITAQLSGLQPSEKSNALNWAWLAIIPIAIMVGLVLLKRKTQHQTLVVETDKDSLLAEIAELDDSYEARKIREEDYLKLRDQKKQQVLRLIKEEKGSNR